MTYDEFIKANGLTVSIAISNIIPQDQLYGTADERNWATSATWYECIAYGNGHEVPITIGCGPACDELTPAEVLDRLANTARGIDIADGYEEWCDETGRDPLGRTTEDDYETCQIIASRTRLVCGGLAVFESLMYETEQL